MPVSPTPNTELEYGDDDVIRRSTSSEVQRHTFSRGYSHTSLPVVLRAAAAWIDERPTALLLDVMHVEVGEVDGGWYVTIIIEEG